MIVRRVRAENILKYARLELRELPPRGLIAISGLNESGKTSIAETICYALFGRTFSLPPADIGKLIRWGETRCFATVDFRANDHDYQVTRQLDDEGHEAARLTIEGQAEPLARGPAAVGTALNELLGYDFDEFTESFYLAQRELISTHPQTNAVRGMAGINTLLAVSEELEEEIRAQQAIIADTEGQVAELERQIQELSLRDERLPELEEERRPLVVAQANREQDRRELENRVSHYRDSVAKVQAAGRSIVSAGVDTSYRVWQEIVANLDRKLKEIEPDSDGGNGGTRLTADLAQFASEANERLTRLGEIRAQATGYRGKLAELLGGTPVGPTGNPAGPIGEPAETASGEEEREAAGEVSPDPTYPLPDRRSEVSHEIDRLRGSRGWSLAGMIVFLIAALALWACWALLFKAPDLEASRRLAIWLTGHVRDWARTYQPLLLPAAGVMTGIFAIFGIRYAILSSRLSRGRRMVEDLAGEIEAVRLEAETLDSLDSLPIAAAVTALSQVKDEAVASAAREFADGPGSDLIDGEKLADQQRRLSELITQYQSQVTRECDRIGVKAAEVGSEIEVQRERVATVDRSIDEERERRRQAADLASMIEALRAKNEDRQRRIRVRELGRVLIAGACREISRLFNRDVRGFVGRTLPLLTQGRYEHLQIGDDLKVRVFSNGKRDFMDLDEISSGTQRQVMLAVRLALSQKLITNARAGEQFVFLDEPFAIYDPERTRATLEALPGISAAMPQIWITGQELPEDDSFDMRIECAREKEELIL